MSTSNADSTQIFMDLTFKGKGPVKGDSRFTGYENLIEIQRFDWGMKLSGNVLDSRSARIEFSDLKVTKSIDASTTELLNGLKNLYEVSVCKIIVATIFHDGGAGIRDALVLELRDGYLTDVELEHQDPGDLVETLTFSSKKMKFFYHPSESRGGGKRLPPLTADLNIDTAI